MATIPLNNGVKMISCTVEEKDFNNISLEGGKLPREKFTPDEIRILTLCCYNLDADLKSRLDMNSLREVLLVDREDILDTAELALADLLVKRIETYEDGCLTSVPCIDKISYLDDEEIVVTLNPSVLSLIQALVSH